MQLINVKNAAFSYGGNIVVKDLNFSIEKGDYLLIVGENGSGKSTLVHLLDRLYDLGTGGP